MSTSSTWGSRKSGLALSAIGCAAAIVIAWAAILWPLARWAELDADSYPYKGGEDALRYLLPTIHGQPGAGRLLVMGSSNAGEGILYQRLDRELPGLHVTHGAVSMARLTEMKILLEYVEKVYGREALPEVIVLGASTRLVSNVPWNEPSRAFHAIDTYSPYYKVESSREEGSRLVRKTGFESLVSRWRMMFKQVPRFRSAMAMLLLEFTGHREPYVEFDDRRDVRALTYAVTPSNRAAPFPEEWVRSAEFIWKVGAVDALARYLRFRYSPYLGHIHPPQSRDDVRSLASSMHMWWKDVRTWAPDDDTLAHRELKDLAAFAESRGIELFVINLPEHPDVVAVYEGNLRVEYLAMLNETFDSRFLNLGDYLSAEQFSDSEHPSFPGAVLLSQSVGEFIERRRLQRG